MCAHGDCTNDCNLNRESYEATILWAIYSHLLRVGEEVPKSEGWFRIWICKYMYDYAWRWVYCLHVRELWPFVRAVPFVVSLHSLRNVYFMHTAYIHVLDHNWASVSEPHTVSLFPRLMTLLPPIQQVLSVCHNSTLAIRSASCSWLLCAHNLCGAVLEPWVAVAIYRAPILKILLHHTTGQYSGK